MRKILLNKNRGKESVNKTNYIPVDFNREVSLHQDEILSETIDTFKVYNEEKDKATNHRFIFTIKPICTNVLFNKISEIVYKEGSDDAQIITNTGNFSTLQTGAISQQSLNRLQAIRNTEYSNDIFNLDYHCGLDIFNNHLLRTKEDITVQKRNTNTKVACEVYQDDTNSAATGFRSLSDAFNTIGDVNRSFNGKDIVIQMPNKNNNYTYTNSLNLKSPLYLYDTINSFEDACRANIKRENGWTGFTNPSSFRIPVHTSSNNEEYYINRCINKKEGCEFIDLAPERNLFSFTPNKNKYRHRIERNWDYCLTYPCKSLYTDNTKTILNGKKHGLLFVENYGETYREYIANNGIICALFQCPVRHNLKIGDSVYLKFGDQNVRCTVVSVGKQNKTNTETYFSVRKDDFEDFLTLGKPIGFTKVVQGFECEYYFRIFKKFDKEHKNSLNRLAFADTIYGDDVTQIIYTEDVDISAYKDNRGRPLTEIYLTILKRNQGHNLWYSDENVCNTPDIEFSHVFGKVTSGLDISETITNKEYPILRSQHNIDVAALKKIASNVTIEQSSASLENDITIENDEFYGDLVEFNPILLTETILEDVYHRFNTAQRELVNHSLYNTLYYDEVAGDIYDAGVTTNTKNRIRSLKLNEKYANLAPEGYIYKPHHKVQIGRFEKDLNQGYNSIMTVNDVLINNAKKTIEFSTQINYALFINSIITVMTHQKEVFKFSISEYTYDKEKNKYVGKGVLIDDKELPVANYTDMLKYVYFRHNLDIPDYAYMLPDNSGAHLWRNIQAPSEWLYTDELYTTPFTNGAFYHHTNITFPVRRQDPFNKYSTTILVDDVPINNNFEIPATEFDYSNVEVLTNNYPTCY